MIVKYCSPVLAGIKTGNMFNYYDSSKNALNIIKGYNKVFNKFGVYFYILNSKNDCSLIYVYRPDMLEKDFKQKYVKLFMTEEGYNVSDIGLCIKTLSERIKLKDDFPHEIGLFLSYPIYDVLGFIKNKGSNFKYCGFWKVYDNEDYAKSVFGGYERCTNLYKGKFDKEKNLLKLVAMA